MSAFMPFESSKSLIYIESINTVIEGLIKAEIPFTHNQIFDGWQIRCPWCGGDVVAHFGSHGADYGHVESYGFPWDEDDVSELTPAEAIALIVKEYYQHKKL